MEEEWSVVKKKKYQCHHGNGFEIMETLEISSPFLGAGYIKV